MAQSWAEPFYNSSAWRKCRESYIAVAGGMCERCNARGRYEPGHILHHKIKLTPSNISNPDISLNHDHLEFLCAECHNIVHGDSEPTRQGLGFDVNGNLVVVSNPKNEDEK